MGVARVCPLRDGDDSLHGLFHLVSLRTRTRVENTVAPFRPREYLLTDRGELLPLHLDTVTRRAVLGLAALRAGMDHCPVRNRYQLPAPQTKQPLENDFLCFHGIDRPDRV